MSKNKVTVLRRMANHDLIEEYGHRTTAPCDLVVFEIERSKSSTPA